MTMKMIEIVVGPTGTTTVQTKGFVGASCQDASRFIEQALGKVGTGKLTTEYFQADQVDVLRQTNS